MASPNIRFDTIPASVRVPGSYGEFNLRLAASALPTNAQNVLIIGQRLKSPSAWVTATPYTVGGQVKPVTSNGHYYVCVVAGTSGGSEPVWPTTHAAQIADGAGNLKWMEYAEADASTVVKTAYQVLADSDARTYFGEGSILHLMAKYAIDANPNVNLTAIALEDGSTTMATATITIAGVATAAGIIDLWVGDQLCEISFAKSDTAAATATSLANALNALRDTPVVATVSGAVVTLTALNAGTVQNQTKVSVTYTAGASLTATANTATLTGGATDPNLQDALDAAFPQQFKIIATCYNDFGNEATPTVVQKLRTHLQSVSGPIEQRPGIGVIGYVGTVANQTTWASNLNERRLIGVTLKNTKTEPWKIAAQFAAVRASEEDPAAPLRGLPLPTVAAPAVSDRYSWTEMNTLMGVGICPLTVVSGTVCIARAVMTYVPTDGNPWDINPFAILDYLRDAVNSMMNTRYPRDKITTKTPASVRSDLYAVLKDCEVLGLVMNVDANFGGLIVEPDLQAVGRLDAKIPSQIVEGLEVFAARFDLML